MKKKYSEYYNNNSYWCKKWYGLELVSDSFSTCDFIDCQGKVFFKTKFKAFNTEDVIWLNGETYILPEEIKRVSDDDWVIGYISKHSDEATILDTYPSHALDKSQIIGFSHVNKDTVTCTRKPEKIALEDAAHQSGYIICFELINKIGAIYRLPVFISYEACRDDLSYHAIVTVDEDGDIDNICVLITDRDGKTELRKCKDAHIIAENEYGSIDFQLDETITSGLFLGYNNDYIYVMSGERIKRVGRLDNKEDDVTESVLGSLKEHVGGNIDCSGLIEKNFAYVDCSRNEAFFYVDDKAKSPKDSNLIGISLDDFHSELICCPITKGESEGLLFFDGDCFIQRLTKKEYGYKVFRKDGTLRKKWIYSNGNSDDLPIVTSFDNLYMMVVGNFLSYTTEGGMCQMFSIDGENHCTDMFSLVDIKKKARDEEHSKKSSLRRFNVEEHSEFSFEVLDSWEDEYEEKYGSRYIHLGGITKYNGYYYYIERSNMENDGEYDFVVIKKSVESREKTVIGKIKSEYLYDVMIEIFYAPVFSVYDGKLLYIDKKEEDTYCLYCMNIENGDIEEINLNYKIEVADGCYPMLPIIRDDYLYYITVSYNTSERVSRCKLSEKLFVDGWVGYEAQTDRVAVGRILRGNQDFLYDYDSDRVELATFSVYTNNNCN